MSEREREQERERERAREIETKIERCRHTYTNTYTKPHIIMHSKARQTQPPSHPLEPWGLQGG